MTILDNHAPLCTKTITSRPDCEWFKDKLLGIKQELRKLERQKLCTGLELHTQIFSKAAKDYRWARTTPKWQYYNTLIVEAGKDQGELFKITDRLVHKSSDLPLPAHETASDLANDFTVFFTDKILKIQATIC